jgi:cobalt-zinc-cadmium efflux system membrane fusion protein
MNWCSRGLPVVLTLVSLGCKHGGGAEKAPAPSLSERTAQLWLTPAQLADAHVVVAPADLQEVDDVIETAGRVAFDDLRVQHVFSPVTGKITVIKAALGQHLKKGDPLAVIESPDIGIASSDFGKAQADLIAAEHDIKRQQALWEAHAASQAQVEASEDNYRRAKAELERAKSKAFLLRTGGADVVTQTYTLSAGIEGELVARMANPALEVQGQYGGGTANELFTIGDLDEVWVLADVFAIDMSRVKVGQPATVRVVTYPDRAFEGKVDWVSGSLDPTTRTVRVRCTFPNADHALKPEMYSTVEIHVDAKRALAVPRTAIFRLGETPVVFVQAETAADGRQRFDRRAVHVDEGESQKWVQVTQGLSKGERVVISGGILLDQ